MEKAKELESLGVHILAIKDMAGLLKPYAAQKLVETLKSELHIPIHLHTHNTAGTGDMVNLMACQAGVDIVDCALSPLANGTSQPATESLVATLQGSDRDTRAGPCQAERGCHALPQGRRQAEEGRLP